jgi:hypothetical protein
VRNDTPATRIVVVAPDANAGADALVPEPEIE